MTVFLSRSHQVTVSFLPPRALVATLLFGLAATPVHAAESYGNCTGFVDSLPATITTEGTWCLRKNLVTAITSGAAIQINANNVTLDCNDFQVTGTAPVDVGTASGIKSANNKNAVVRNCLVREFFQGVSLVGTGHRVLDNRFDGNGYRGIAIEGEGEVRANRVMDTGGAPRMAIAIEVTGTVDVINNTIVGVLPGLSGAEAIGIMSSGNDGGSISRNRIRGVLGNWSYGIMLPNPLASVRATPKTWHDAKADCEAYGMQLATIANAAEAVYLRDTAGTYRPVWIGGTDEAVEGSWRWLNGKPFDYTNWEIGQPSDPDGTRDHLLMGAGLVAGRWSTGNGADKYSFLCEQPDLAPVILRNNVIVGPGARSTAIFGWQCRAKGNQIAQVADPVVACPAQ